LCLFLGLDEIECRFPPYISNSYYTSQTSRRVTQRCENGYVFNTSSGSMTELTRRCDARGIWSPPPQICRSWFFKQFS